MRQKGITAPPPKARISRAGEGHRLYPCLPKDLVIERANQVLAAATGYVPMARGFVNVAAIMGRYGRKVLA